MKLICAVVILSLVLHVIQGAPSTNSSRKVTGRYAAKQMDSQHYPIIWNKQIGIVNGPLISNLYCCNMPPRLQNCSCCALLCRKQQPSLMFSLPSLAPQYPSLLTSCCHWPSFLQNCDCCPSACHIPILPPPPNCCHIPKPLQNCNCCPSACFPPPIADCCSLPRPFLTCQCCPGICQPAFVPLNESCCHWPPLWQDCHCCVTKCQKPPNRMNTTTTEAPDRDCCDLPRQFQDCECCPGACTTPPNTTTPKKSKTTPILKDCCHLPKKFRKCSCCKTACHSPTTTADCCHVPEDERDCDCCPTACLTSTTGRPFSCCHLPIELQNCNCCPDACQTTSKPEPTTESVGTITTDIPSDCCHEPEEHRNCDCCPSACEESSTSEKTTTYFKPTHCCHLPKEQQKCSCCPSACSEETTTELSTSYSDTLTQSTFYTTETSTNKEMTSDGDNFITSTTEIKTEREPTPWTTEQETSSTIENKITTTGNEQTESLTTKLTRIETSTPSTADCCAAPKEEQHCRCCPSACAPPTVILYTNCCNWPKHLQMCSCCSFKCSVSRLTSHQTSCCHLPLSRQHCSCCLTSPHCKEHAHKKERPTELLQEKLLPYVMEDYSVPNKRWFRPRQTESMFVRYKPKIFTFIGRSSLHSPSKVSDGFEFLSSVSNIANNERNLGTTVNLIIQKLGKHGESHKPKTAAKRRFSDNIKFNRIPTSENTNRNDEKHISRKKILRGEYIHSNSAWKINQGLPLFSDSEIVNGYYPVNIVDPSDYDYLLTDEDIYDERSNLDTFVGTYSLPFNFIFNSKVVTGLSPGGVNNFENTNEVPLSSIFHNENLHDFEIADSSSDYSLDLDGTLDNMKSIFTNAECPKRSLCTGNKNINSITSKRRREGNISDRTLFSTGTDLSSAKKNPNRYLLRHPSSIISLGTSSEGRISNSGGQYRKFDSTSDTYSKLSELVINVSRNSSDYVNFEGQVELLRIKKSDVHTKETNHKMAEQLNTFDGTTARNCRKCAKQQSKSISQRPRQSLNNLNRRGNSSDKIKKETRPTFDQALPPEQSSQRWSVIYGSQDFKDLTQAPSNFEKTDENDDGIVDSTSSAAFEDRKNSNEASSIILIIPHFLPFHSAPFSPYYRPPLSFPQQYCLFAQFTPLCAQMVPSYNIESGRISPDKLMSGTFQNEINANDDYINNNDSEPDSELSEWLYKQGIDITEEDSAVEQGTTNVDGSNYRYKDRNSGLTTKTILTSSVDET